MQIVESGLDADVLMHMYMYQKRNRCSASSGKHSETTQCSAVKVLKTHSFIVYPVVVFAWFFVPNEHKKAMNLEMSIVEPHYYGHPLDYAKVTLIVR